MYPKYPQWLEVYNELNASGMFNSQLTDRLGISRGSTLGSSDVTPTKKKPFQKIAQFKRKIFGPPR
jgi:hypothetical protein